MKPLTEGDLLIQVDNCPQIARICEDRVVRWFDCCDTGMRSHGLMHDGHSCPFYVFMCRYIGYDWQKNKKPL